MDKKQPEYVALAHFEMHTAPGARVTMRPFVNSENGVIPSTPWHLVLTQEEARALAQDLLDCADQSQEEAQQLRQ